MSYADLLNKTPIANRTSTDRLMAPPSLPKKTTSQSLSANSANGGINRNSLTPDSRNLSSSRFCIIPNSPSFSPLRQMNSDARFKIQRSASSSLSQKLFSTISNSQQDVFGNSLIRRQSSSDFSCSPNGSNSGQKRQLPSKPNHKIAVEGISSDFYISPMDWSKSQQIAFSISGNLVFINPKTCDIISPKNAPTDATALKFSNDGQSLSIGCDDGRLEIYSPLNMTMTSSYDISEATVLVSDWKDNTIASGCRDGLFSLIDVRDNEITLNDKMHFEEICGVKFSMHDRNIIATSSNDCVVKIWDIRHLANPVIQYQEHTAAIRALMFSPTADNIIATGGGTSDKTIKLWDINTGDTIYSIDTGSQVCNLFWNEEYNEIFSTHGFSQNHLALWKGADLSPVAQFYEHKQRVLFMAPSPDGTKVVTAAPNDGIQIWQMFPSQRLSLTHSMQLVR